MFGPESISLALDVFAFEVFAFSLLHLESPTVFNTHTVQTAKTQLEQYRTAMMFVIRMMVTMTTGSRKQVFHLTDLMRWPYVDIFSSHIRNVGTGLVTVNQVSCSYNPLKCTVHTGEVRHLFLRK